jgi:uncharacterized RmlC-like cupin family protein
MKDSACDEKPDWKNHRLRVIRSGELDTNGLQTPCMTRAEAISRARVGAQKLGRERCWSSPMLRPALIIMGNWKT